MAQVGTGELKAIMHENAAHEWNNCNMDANECKNSFSIITTALCLFSHKVPTVQMHRF